MAWGPGVLCCKVVTKPNCLSLALEGEKHSTESACKVNAAGLLHLWVADILLKQRLTRQISFLGRFQLPDI